jgi:hypothetical protein
MVLALVLFLISAFWQPAPPPARFPEFKSLGLFFWVLAEILLKTVH